MKTPKKPVKKTSGKANEDAKKGTLKPLPKNSKPVKSRFIDDEDEDDDLGVPMDDFNALDGDFDDIDDDDRF